MKIELSLGFEVVVSPDGSFELPPRPFTTSELKKIAREINRALRSNLAESNVNEVLYNED